MNGNSGSHANMVAATGGAASAAVSRLLGHVIRMAIGVPFVPSVIVGFPRGTILLSAAGSLNRFGVLTAMGAVEGLGLLALGASLPFALICPTMSALAADLAYLVLRKRLEQQRLLSVMGAVLNVARPLTAMALWWLFGPPRAGTRTALLPWLLATVLVLNALTGLLAGRLAANLLPYLRKLGLRHEPAH